MRITDLPTPGAYVNSQKLRIEAVKAISAIELTHTGPGKAITAITVATAGADYIDGTYELEITGVGSGARATATVTSGAVASVDLLAGGSGYVSAPTIALPQEAVGEDEEGVPGDGAGATFTSTQGTVVRTTADAQQLADFFTACATALADYLPE